MKTEALGPMFGRICTAASTILRNWDFRTPRANGCNVERMPRTRPGTTFGRDASNSASEIENSWMPDIDGLLRILTVHMHTGQRINYFAPAETANLFNGSEDG